MPGWDIILVYLVVLVLVVKVVDVRLPWVQAVGVILVFVCEGARVPQCAGCDIVLVVVVYLSVRRYLRLVGVFK